MSHTETRTAVLCRCIILAFEKLIDIPDDLLLAVTAIFLYCACQDIWHNFDVKSNKTPAIKNIKKVIDIHYFAALQYHCSKKSPLSSTQNEDNGDFYNMISFINYLIIGQILSDNIKYHRNVNGLDDIIGHAAAYKPLLNARNSVCGKGD